MIKLSDFFEKLEDPNNTKIKFNMNPSDRTKRAWDFLLDETNDWILMNSWKTKQPNNNLGNAKYLIALAQYYPYGPEYFVFGGVYKIEMVEPEVFNDYGYKLTLTDQYIEFRKRLIIKLKKPIAREVYTRLYDNVQDQLEPEVYEISPNTKLGYFPGYQNISLTFKDLQQVISRNEPSWKSALSNVKGIYVITDRNTGKLYIGSASGNSGLWQRWSDYSNYFTGGNVGFEEILKTLGEEYIKEYFTYTIIEIFDSKTKNDYIIEREMYWQKVFRVKEHGMNK